MLRKLFKKLKAAIILKKYEAASVRIDHCDVATKVCYSAYIKNLPFMDPEMACEVEKNCEENRKSIVDSRNTLEIRLREIEDYFESIGDTTSRLYKKAVAIRKKMAA